MSSGQRHRLPTILLIDNADLSMIVADALQRDFGKERHAVKRIARAANSNERSAENWYRGVNAPDAMNLLRLMAHSPVLAGEVRRLTALSQEHDPEFERAFNAAITLFMKTRAP